MSTKATKTWHQTLSEAVDWYIRHGWTSDIKLQFWYRRLSVALQRETGDPETVRRGLTKIYNRLVVQGGVLREKGYTTLSPITLRQVKPELRAELDRRIAASVNLIVLNREKAVAQTLQRFSGWVTSIPPGGIEKTAKKGRIVSALSKSKQQLDYEARRLAIDQGHKIISNVKYILAVQSGAIALRWHSDWRRPGYNYRPQHKERDEKIYLLRDTWALNQGLIKPVNGYYDQITAAGEEPYCSCQAYPVYSPAELPDEFLTQKWKRDHERN